MNFDVLQFFTRNFFPQLNVFSSQVSWIRKRDLHILTTGTSSYTSDQRFQVIGSWFLLCHFFPFPLIGFAKDLSSLFLTHPNVIFSQVIRSHDLGNWTLQIKYPHLRDNGVYEVE